jgi:cysteine desulfurase
MMLRLPVFMDHHATTPVDPAVVAAMLPYFTEKFGNAGSVNHPFGGEARDAVDAARASIATAIGAGEKEIIFTSGATESDNLAIRGVAERPRRRGDHIISVTTEHKAVLEPIARLGRRGYAVSLVPVKQHGADDAGIVDVEQIAAALRDDTVLVSVMLANNEVGAIQPIAEIGEICRERGITFHCDATQAVGKLPVKVDTLSVDLMSFSAHKMYGPKGVGALYVRRRTPSVRLDAQITGGGQEGGLRGGTLNVPGIVGFATAVELSLAAMDDEQPRLRAMRDRLNAEIMAKVDGTNLNGPRLDRVDWRLAGNLNMTFDGVDGEALMMSIKDLAVSSGAACTSANPEPSHVLQALGLSVDQARSSLRFGLGRFNTDEETAFAAEAVASAVLKLRRLSRS